MAFCSPVRRKAPMETNFCRSRVAVDGVVLAIVIAQSTHVRRIYDAKLKGFCDP